MNGFNIEIQYSDKVKGATLEVWPGNLVKVIAPIGAIEEDLTKIVSKKTKWIIEKQRVIKDIPAWREREFVSGESFPLLGREYRLKTIEGYGDTILKDDRLIVPVAPFYGDIEDRAELIKLSLVKWYKEFALGKIADRVEYYSEQLGVRPSKVTLKDYVGRWGSCTPSGELIFNWQIIALPRNLFEYVVAHEVAHLNELNHGRGFKRVLASLVQDSELSEQHLKYYKNVF